MIPPDEEQPQSNPYAPPAHDEIDQRVSDAEPGAGPRGIGGWLILPLLHLILTPVMSVIVLVRDYAPMFAAGGDWSVIIDPTYDGYHPMWAPLLVFEILSHIGFIAASIVGLFMMFRHAVRFPRFMIYFYVANLTVLVLDHLWASAIPVLAAEPDPQFSRDLARGVIACAIWIPYFLRSKRVANTFIQP